MINPLTGFLEFNKEEASSSSKKGFTDINAHFCPVQSTLPIEEKVKLVCEVGEEILNKEELYDLFKRKEMPIVYDGFEPSGRMHIAQGVLSVLNVNRLTKAGCICVYWVADWFAQMNNKMGGDLEKIKVVGRYFVEIWKAAGLDLRNVKFLWASDEINKHPHEYWQNVIDVARVNNLDRIKRCCQIMGRKEGDALSAGQILYPCMQCTDVFYLKSDITSLGMDQRKVNVLAREYCDSIGKKDKPIIVSHYMIKGLIQGAEKMSKSIPDSAIFMEDSKEDVERKIKKAYCPEKEIDTNPLFDFVRHLIFPKFGKFECKRDAKYGGDITYNTYEEICQAYKEGKLDPVDLKNNLARLINLILEPIRQHFQNDPEAKKLLELVRSYKTTR